MNPHFINVLIFLASLGFALGGVHGAAIGVATGSGFAILVDALSHFKVI